ncbi:MAG TPA: hypothetical protein VFP21_09275, partial [Solirubrobacterales bacterium]|nr:hypothetical protein [Solirubrobacterales bacterium]
KTVKNFGNSLGGLNTFFNELAYKPKGGESYLFYLPWLNHNYNASFSLQDAGGPIQRGLVLVTCNSSKLGYGAAAEKPFLKTLLEVAGVPRPSELPPFKATPKERATGDFSECGPGTRP